MTALVDDDEAWSFRETLSVAAIMIDERSFRDSNGTEWDVFDERSSGAMRALECDYPMPERDPGLVFVSRVGRKRLWPCPADWHRMPDHELEHLCGRAASLAD
jgi:hypothetical protein